MTRAIPIGVLACALVATIADAGPVSAPPAPEVDPNALDPIAVVGTYTATLRWTGCSAPGERTAELELRSVDRELKLDLAPAQAGLGIVVVGGDAKELTGGVADLAVTLVRKQRGTFAITIELAAGCRARGTLRLAASGIAQCDRLVALASIEAGCSAIADADRIVDADELAAERATWSGLRGARKREADAACRPRAATLHSELIDVACMEVPAHMAPRPVPECRALAATIARLSRCPSLPDDQRARLRSQLGQFATFVDPAPSSIEADPAILLCDRLHEQLIELGARHGC